MKHPVDIHVGKRLRERRLDMGMTQQQLADRVGVKFQQIQKYESGSNRVSASRLWDIASALETRVDSFFEGYTNGAINGKMSAKLRSGNGSDDIARTISSLPVEKQQKLFKLAMDMNSAA